MGNERYNPNQGKNPYRVSREPERNSTPSKYSRSSIDFDTQRICASCGGVIKISHNFCKFCGVDLSGIEPLGYSDRTLKELAYAALTDTDPGVRKDAVNTLGDLGEREVLGVFSYILLNDSDESVRKEAASELGKAHHPYSLDILAKALRDQSPIVRKEAIEGLKKIKKRNKPEKIEDTKEIEEKTLEANEAQPKTIEFSEITLKEEEQEEESLEAIERDDKEPN